MPHTNVRTWLTTTSRGDPRPCDWCGDPLSMRGSSIHVDACGDCGRKCYDEEATFYTQLGYDGHSDVKPPPGYIILIPKSK